MKHTVLKSLAVASVLAMGIAACGSSGSSTSGGSTNKAATGKTLVIESTPLSPMTDTFNPYSQTSTGYIANAISLYNEPLYIFNTLNPAQAPIPFLASGQPTWSNGGMTLTIPIRSGVKWNDGKPFSASDVAYTFNLVKTTTSLYTAGAPPVKIASLSFCFTRSPIANAADESGTSVTTSTMHSLWRSLFTIPDSRSSASPPPGATRGPERCGCGVCWRPLVARTW